MIGEWRGYGRELRRGWRRGGRSEDRGQMTEDNGQRADDRGTGGKRTHDPN